MSDPVAAPDPVPEPSPSPSPSPSPLPSPASSLPRTLTAVHPLSVTKDDLVASQSRSSISTPGSQSRRPDAFMAVLKKQIQQSSDPSIPVPPSPRPNGSVGEPHHSSSPDPLWSRLQQLATLTQQGLITDGEYEERKRQLVDQMTGTKRKDQPNGTRSRRTKVRPGGGAADINIHMNMDEGNGRDRQQREQLLQTRHLEPTFTIPTPPPDFTNIPSERAVLYLYDIDTATWTKHEKHVKIDPNPFARGSLRVAHHIQGLEDVTEPGAALLNMKGSLPGPGHGVSVSIPTSSNSVTSAGSSTYIAKISIDPYEERDAYFQDVHMQMYAKMYAARYNEYKPPKQVDFVKAWIMELTDRPQRPICAVERFITGPYRKHNNNFGYVSEEERNTPQAFSHFTYEASQRTILICDIQGVGDLYTDPQIHSLDGLGFGKGNMGDRGIDKFLATHRFNAICRFLKLPIINAKMDDMGTVPATRYMSYTKVEVINVNIQPMHHDNTPYTLAPIIKKTPAPHEMGPRKRRNRSPPAHVILPSRPNMSDEKQPLITQGEEHETTKCCLCVIL